MNRNTIQRTITISTNIRDKLDQIAKLRPQPTSQSVIIREAIRHYLDEQEDLIGSRRHFQKSLQDRITRLEQALSFQLSILIYLIAKDETHIQNAIIHARRDGETLQAQIQAVRDLDIRT